MHQQIIRAAALGLILFAGITKSFSQQQPTINTVVDKLTDYRRSTLQEKLYVHTDQSFYLTGELIWLKIYCVDASVFTPLAVSKVAYAELIDRDKKPAVQVKIALNDDGRGYGSIFLPSLLNSGHYVLRVYTNWMKNFGPDKFYEQAVTIINPFTKLGLKTEQETAKLDAQFFPEGGNLVNGIPGKVAFRVVDQTGRGIDFRGSIINEHGDTLQHFRPLKYGLGNFVFTPDITQRYKVVIRSARDVVSTYSLPEISHEGYVMQVKDSTADKIKIAVDIRLASVQNPTIYLLAHTRNIPGITKVGYLHNNKATFVIDKNELKDGLSHLTIFNDKLQPVCERLYFRRATRRSQLDVRPDQSLYSTRRKVTLNFYAHTNDQPLTTDLSVSVFKVDSTATLEQPGINDYLSFTSELRGNIEGLPYYLADGDDANRSQAIENLLLTHGWSKFSWEHILNKPATYAFVPEVGGHIIYGQITDAISGLPTKQIVTYLSTPSKTIDLYLSRSNQDGQIQFEMKNFVGSKELILQTNTTQDSSYVIKLQNPFLEKYSETIIPAFDLAENSRKEIEQRSIHMQVQNTFYREKINRFTTPAVDSIPFYGKADERYRLDDYTRFPTMEEVMREYVPGVLVRKTKGKFHFKTLDQLNKSIFSDNPLVLVDGLPVFNIDKIMAFDPRKVKKLDVLTRKYYLGALSFDGIVSYTTYGGDLATFQPDPKSLIVNYEGLQPYREFFSPRYESQQARETKLPDVRTLLFWSPVASTDSTGKGHVEFYTSDVPGKYAVVVQGITRTGEPVSSSSLVEVKDSSNY